MPTRLAWVTDPHLNHVPLQAWEQWINVVLLLRADGVVITGDVSESDDVVFQLIRLASELAMPVYFVLGNHDFYQGSIPDTRRRVIEAARDESRLNYLTDCRPIHLDDGVYLIGEDGWGDATVGDYENSLVRLNDFALIQDFSCSDPARWKEMLIGEGQASAQRVAEKIEQVPADARQLLIATHVPPFRESCWYQGKTTDDHWAPFFVCGSIGRVLDRASQDRPQCMFTVLCGHTHNEGIARMRDNLIVYTGAAEYGVPEVEGMIESGHDQLRVELK